jgi:hypothetical protein
MLHFAARLLSEIARPGSRADRLVSARNILEAIPWNSVKKSSHRVTAFHEKGNTQITLITIYKKTLPKCYDRWIDREYS